MFNLSLLPSKDGFNDSLQHMFPGSKIDISLKTSLYLFTYLEHRMYNETQFFFIHLQCSFFLQSGDVVFPMFV